MSKQQKTEHASPPRSDLFRIAEMQHMRRQTMFTASGSRSYYECGLCLGKSADLLGEIEHKDGCPVLRVK